MKDTSAGNYTWSTLKHSQRNISQGYHSLHLLIAVTEQPCKLSAQHYSTDLELSHTITRACDLSSKSTLLLPRMSNCRLSSPEGAISILLPTVLKSRSLNEAGHQGGRGRRGILWRRGFQLKLVSVQHHVPALPFSFLCCVVILATLISVLHFILTSKGNTTVKFHWNLLAVSGPPRLVGSFWHLQPTLALQPYKRDLQNTAGPQNPLI